MGRFISICRKSAPTSWKPSPSPLAALDSCLQAWQTARRIVSGLFGPAPAGLCIGAPPNVPKAPFEAKAALLFDHPPMPGAGRLPQFGCDGAPKPIAGVFQVLFGPPKPPAGEPKLPILLIGPFLPTPAGMSERRRESPVMEGIGSSESSKSAELPRCLERSSTSVLEPLRSWLVGLTLLGRCMGAGRWIGCVAPCPSKRSFSLAEACLE